MTRLLHVDGLAAGYGGPPVIEGVSFELREGERFTGVDRPSAELLEALIADLAAEGRGILIATHDLDQALAWDEVLCLNRRQVAFGRPGETLTRSVLEQTYGGAVVALPGAGAPVGILPAHHHEGHEHE
jgi:ABC-type cobalamin transport system ATPase subunit